MIAKPSSPPSAKPTRARRLPQSALLASSSQSASSSLAPCRPDVVAHQLRPMRFGKVYRSRPSAGCVCLTHSRGIWRVYSGMRSERLPAMIVWSSSHSSSVTRRPIRDPHRCARPDQVSLPVRLDVTDTWYEALAIAPGFTYSIRACHSPSGDQAEATTSRLTGNARLEEIHPRPGEDDHHRDYHCHHERQAGEPQNPGAAARGAIENIGFEELLSIHGLHTNSGPTGSDQPLRCAPIPRDLPLRTHPPDTG